MQLIFSVSSINEVNEIFKMDNIKIGARVNPDQTFQADISSIAKDRCDSNIILSCIISFSVSATANIFTNWLISVLKGKTNEIKINKKTVNLSDDKIVQVVEEEMLIK